MPAATAPRLARFAAALILAGLTVPAWTADGHDAKPEAKPEAKPAAPKKAAAEAHGEHAPAADAKPAKPVERATPPQDPMDKLRERLAEKLGATKAAPSNPNVVRVAARPQAEAEHAPAVSAARAAAPVSRPKPAAAAHDAGHAAHWSYDGEGGPGSWGAMKPEFATCTSGKRQSPIDIRGGIKVQLDPVQFDYRPSGFRVVDNGHTIQVNVGAGNSIEVMGRRYELLQFHFHRPSEERIDGRQFDMVAHLVHKDLEGRLAVVAVLLDRGSAQPLVQTIWNNLPLEKGDEVAAKGAIDMNALLPPDRSYFTYMGSLTTPPCSEGVLWMVMKQPVPISPDQIAIFSRLYPMNARPIQSASGRLIKESN
jgi:carbonic anhydrase